MTAAPTVVDKVPAQPTDSRMQDEAQAAQALPAHMVLMKMENEGFQALAASRPRDMAEIKRELDVTLTEFPILAEEAIYNKPVGFVFLILCQCGNQYEVAKNVTPGNECPRCEKYKPKENPKKIQKYARDLSIRAAETLAEVYGFNRVRCDVNPTAEDGRFKVEATFVDFQKGRIWQDAGIVSQWYKPHGSYTLVKAADDRFFNITLKAEKSKYIREVINRCVNQGLKAWFYARCEQIQEALLDDGTVKKIVTQFASKGVNLEMIEQLLGGKPQSSGWTIEDKKTLLGIWNGLKNGETTVNELFRSDSDPKNTPPAGGTNPAGAVSASDLTKPAAGNGNGNGGAANHPADSNAGSGQQASGEESQTAPAGASEPSGPPGGQLSPKGAELIAKIEKAAGDKAALTGLLQDMVAIYKSKPACVDPEGVWLYRRLDALLAAAKGKK